MVTPSYSADCANVEHACHESYARCAVLAHWRHMATLTRHRMIRNAVGMEPVPPVCLGGTIFVDPSVDALVPEEQRYLGTCELYLKFEGKLDGRHNNVGWTLALMEMLVDPMLKQWVPSWLVEQYERANPVFFFPGGAYGIGRTCAEQCRIVEENKAKDGTASLLAGEAQRYAGQRKL